MNHKAVGVLLTCQVFTDRELVPEQLCADLVEACENRGATVEGKHIHRFEPQGATIFVILGESHAAISTYPEHETFFVDIFTCGTEIDPARIAVDFCDKWGGLVDGRLLQRGVR